MYVNTFLGKPVDVGPAIRGNIGASTLLGSGPGVNPNVSGSLSPALHASASNPVIGNWFKVPDDSIVQHTSINDPIIALVPYVWTLPDGSAIQLRPSEFRGSNDILNIFRSTNTFHDCYVKFTENTRAGLVAYGIVPPSQAPPPTPAEPQSTPEAIASGVRNLMVIAVIGAAIYFLPKGLLKGKAA